LKLVTVMWIIIVLILLYGINSFIQRPMSRVKVSLANLGSDELIRPDDEDSPEFKEYLRALLRMQANRAKQGFSAPSSGSSDAYIAKLSRLKVERNARIRAGLSDVVDTSYRPEDFEMAKYESAEPAVRAAGMAGNGIRKLTPDEVLMAEMAKEKIRAELNGEPIPKGPTHVTARVSPDRPQSSTKMDASTLSMIDRIVDGGVGGVLSGPRVPSQDRKDNREEIKKRMMATKKKETAVVEAPKVVPKPVSTEPKKPVILGDALRKDEMEIAAQALHSLVRHRGGGPFGRGRLEGHELEEMQEKLLQIMDILKKKDGPLVGAPAPAPVAELESVVPVPERLMVDLESTSNPSLRQPVPVAIDPENTSIAMQDTVSTTQLQCAPGQPETIAMGLDNFLSDPSRLSDNQLNSLRDGLIQCLGMIVKELNSPRSGRHPAQAIPPQSQEVLATAPVQHPATVTKEPQTMEEELRQALGLLLKHRGGPGFGHGRLVGGELDSLESRLRSVSAKLREEAIV